MNNYFKIAIVAPPFGQSGGPEVVTQNLAEALTKLGHDVTLFAPGDWKTNVRHIPTLDKSIWNMNSDEKEELLDLRVKSQTAVVEYSQNFDLIHFNSQRYAYIAAKEINKPCVISFHNKIKDEVFLNCKEAGMHAVALSQSQKNGFDTSAVIHNGVPVKDIKFSDKKGGDYLIFVGRLSDQKGIDRAIQIALKAKRKLLIFGRIGNTQERKDFFKKEIEPYLDNENIIYKGEVSHEEIFEYLRNASALLFPIRRPEVCPMVVAESLACGTPVIGTKVAPLPEILSDKRAAFLSDDEDELVSALQNIETFNRSECRKYAEENFDSLVMAKKYLELYKKILNK